MKKLVTLGMVACLSVAGCMTAFAGQWQSDAQGKWYVNDDGHYPTNAWQEIDGKHYYFGADGYLLVDTITPDGYLVGSDGSWVRYSLSDENAQQKINEFVELYEGAFYIDEAEFEQNVRSFYTPDEAQAVIDLIRSNHTFVPDTSLQDGGIDTSGWVGFDGQPLNVEVGTLDHDQSLTPKQNEAINNSSWG